MTGIYQPAAVRSDGDPHVYSAVTVAGVRDLVSFTPFEHQAAPRRRRCRQRLPCAAVILAAHHSVSVQRAVSSPEAASRIGGGFMGNREDEQTRTTSRPILRSTGEDVTRMSFDFWIVSPTTRCRCSTSAAARATSWTPFAPVLALRVSPASTRAPLTLRRRARKASPRTRLDHDQASLAGLGKQFDFVLSGGAAPPGGEQPQEFAGTGRAGPQECAGRGSQRRASHRDGAYIRPRPTMTAVFHLKRLLSRVTKRRIELFGKWNNIGEPIVSYYSTADLEPWPGR